MWLHAHFTYDFRRHSTEIQVKVKLQPFCSREAGNMLFHCTKTNFTCHIIFLLSMQTLFQMLTDLPDKIKKIQCSGGNICIYLVQGSRQFLKKAIYKRKIPLQQAASIFLILKSPPGKVKKSSNKAISFPSGNKKTIPRA